MAVAGEKREETNEREEKGEMREGKKKGGEGGSSIAFGRKFFFIWTKIGEGVFGREIES